jgi:hypothetical protein
MVIKKNEGDFYIELNAFATRTKRVTGTLGMGQGESR